MELGAFSISLAFRTNNMKAPAGRARKIATLVGMLERGETLVPNVGAEAADDGDSRPRARAYGRLRRLQPRTV